MEVDNILPQDKISTNMENNPTVEILPPPVMTGPKKRGRKSNLERAMLRSLAASEASVLKSGIERRGRSKSLSDHSSDQGELSPEAKRDFVPSSPTASRKERNKSESEQSESGENLNKTTTPIKKGKHKFEFNPPPEAPIFIPTDKEFEDPLEYIKKIRPLAQKHGICKIIPPKHWKPPFSLNHDHFKFTPRIQRINELEARTRITLNFLDQIAKFWAIQGTPLKVPLIGRSMLDLYLLHKTVLDEGGPEAVMKGKKWNTVANKMGLPGKASVLRSHYDHIIYPFYLFQKQHSEPKNKEKVKEEENQEEKVSEKLSKREEDNSVLDQTFGKDVSLLDDSFNSTPSITNSDTSNDNELKQGTFRELKSLQFLGPGPKMAVCNINSVRSLTNRTRGKKVLYNFDPMDKYVCKNCSNDDVDEPLVGCEKCEDKYHTCCVIPPLTEVPSKGWKCPKCLASEVCKPVEEFGFAQAQREYTLKQFGEMANKFKSKYFKSHGKPVPYDQVENEFWRVVSSIEEAVTVEYGADLHTIDVGSGFPTKNNHNIPGVDEEEASRYVDCKWNLNNLAILKESALKHISADISGMKIPWVYVGMCFATFCWHIEDHWSYSINYLHWGEPKTWYGVPGAKAEFFEQAMKSVAAELFCSQPDLLHHLVTIMNPNVLMGLGVPVYRTDQKAGEFVVTFPRAYHAGFNQGFNFAEACNFAPSDWLKIGRECINHYSSLKRFCVFSHDELVCKMVELHKDLDEHTLLATFKDFQTMLKQEQRKREQLLKIGVKEAIKENFDILPDDERQCFVCKTTCFLSALYCTCDPSKLVCLEHIDKLCLCSPKKFILKYHYRIDELWQMYITLKPNAERFDDWLERANNTFTKKNQRLPLRDFCGLLAEANEKEFPRTDFIEYLEYSVRQCLEYSAVARELVERVVSKEPRANGKKPTMEELTMFVKEMEDLPCIIAETTAVKDILSAGKKFQLRAKKLLSSPNLSKQRFAECINMGNTLNMDFEELPLLKEKGKIVDWCQSVNEVLSDKKVYDIKVIKRLLATAPELDKSCPEVDEHKITLAELLGTVETFQTEASNVLSSKIPLPIDDIENIKGKGEMINFKVPEKENLDSLLENCNSWMNKAKQIMAGKVILSLVELDSFLSEAKVLPAKIPLLNVFEQELNNIKEWKQKADKMFLKNNLQPLMKVLWPRRFKTRTMPQRNTSSGFDIVFEETLDFEEAKFQELSSLMMLRTQNIRSKLRPNEPVTCACGKEVLAKESLECNLCRTMYHPNCIGLEKEKVSSVQYGLPIKLLCSFCVRTRRPTAENLIISLMKDTPKILIPEYILCRKFSASIKNWTNKAKEVLNMPEMKNGIEAIMETIKSKKKLLTQNILEEDVNSNQDLGILSKIKPGWGDIYKHVEISRRGIVALRKLMIEGELLEAALLEKTQIWILLQASTLEFRWAYIRRDVTNEVIPKPVKPRKGFVIKKKTEKGGPKIKRINISELKRLGQLIDSPAPKTRKVSQSTTVSDSFPDEKESDIDELEDKVEEVTESVVEEITDEKCAAANCLNPADTEVDWVQCDGKCGLWFHMRCVDITKHDITAEDEYICLKCLSDQNHPEQEVEISIALPEISQPLEDPLL